MKRKTSAAKLRARFAQLPREWLTITRRLPQVNPDNVWNTLIMLEYPPIERLRWGLSRGRAWRLPKTETQFLKEFHYSKI